MSDFLVVLSSPAESSAGEAQFTQGLGIAQGMMAQQPSTVAQGPGFFAASFPRRDGTGGTIAHDAATGSWALAAGTWFHARGFGSGAEAQLLARFLEAGVETLARELDGFFAIVLGDARTGETFVITDAIGGHHTFTRVAPGVVAIAGSSLVLAGMGAQELDPLGVQELIRTGIMHEGRTVHRRVRRLGGGRIHRFRDGVPGAATVYWRPSDVAQDRLEGAEAADALYGALVESARKIARLEPRILLDLTGGYDSRAVAAGFLGAQVPFTTNVTGEEDSGDVVTAARVAKTMGIEHHWIPPRPVSSFAGMERVLPFTDGEYDMVEYAQIFAVQSALLEKFGVSVHGSAGEIGRGHLWVHLLPRIGQRGPIDAKVLVATRYASLRADPALFPADQRLELNEYFLAMVARATADLAAFPNTLQSDAVFLSLRMSNWQGRIASSTDRLRRSIGPFLLRSVLEPMLGMTIQTRYRSRVVREMLARHQPRLARIPMGRGYPPLPFTLRTAASFWPLPVWYAKRVVSKASRIVTRSGAVPTSFGSVSSPRLALWQEDAVRERLRPESMRSAAMLDPEGLERFLAASQRPDFRFDGAWNRILGLETMLRRLDEARRIAVPAIPEAAAQPLA